MRSLRMWFKMTLTPSDVASLTATLTYWEYAEYVSGAFVALACVGEYIASFKPWFTGGDKERKERLEKRSTLLLIVALAAELICLVRTNQISGQVIGALDTKAAEAYRKSGLAITNSDSAARKAKSASDEADGASATAQGASDVAGAAANKATEASQRADGANASLAKLGERISNTFGARQLTEHGRKDLTERLREFSDVQVDVYMFIDDQWAKDEALPFATSVFKALESTPLDVAGRAPLTCTLPGFVGVIVSAPNDFPSKDFKVAMAIFSALKADGIDMYPAIVPVDLEHLVPKTCMFSGFTSFPKRTRFTQAKVRIIIGRRPMGIFRVEKPELPGTP